MDLILLIMVIWSAGVIIYLAGTFSNANAAPDNGTAAADTVLDASIEDTATPIREADAIVSSKLLIDNGFIDPDNNCELCTRMVYTPGSKSEAGIAYKDDTVDLGNAERIVFFAKGEQAQQVSFVAAGNSTSASNTNDTDIFPKIDFAVATDNVTLKNDWQRFEIGLNGTDLSDASYPFGIQMTADSSQKQTFFIKGVTLDTKPPVNPLPTAFDSLLNSTGQLTAKIDANSTNSTAATTIEFTANTTGGLAPYSMKWDFGDGNSTDNVGQKVLRTFDKPGDYNITLSAEDSGTPSQNTSASMLITISPAANKTDSELSNLTMAATNSTLANATAAISDTNSTTGLNTYGIAGIHSTQAIKNTTNTTPVATSLTGSNYTISSNTRNSSEELHDENLEQITIASPRNVTIGTDKTINVKSLNHPPVAGDQSLTLDANETANITLKGNDQDKDLITFDLTSAPSKGTIVGFDSKLGSLTYVPNPNSDSIDIFTFKVTDTKQEVSSNAKVSIKVLNPIPDPSPASSGRQSIKDIHDDVSKENITILGSSDSNLQDVSSTDHRLVERPVQQQSELINHDPSVNAGPDRTVYEGTNGVTLKGTARDTDGDRLSYSWEQAAGESAVLSDANTVKPKFNAPDVNGDTVLVFKLTVSDGKGGQGTDDVKIRVRDKPGDNSQLARDLSREPIPADYQTSDFIK